MVPYWSWCEKHEVVIEWAVASATCEYSHRVMWVRDTSWHYVKRWAWSVQERRNRVKSKIGENASRLSRKQVVLGHLQSCYLSSFEVSVRVIFVYHRSNVMRNRTYWVSGLDHWKAIVSSNKQAMSCHTYIAILLQRRRMWCTHLFRGTFCSVSKTLLEETAILWTYGEEEKRDQMMILMIYPQAGSASYM